MKRFKDYLTKFVWGRDDVEHEKKLKKETKVERAKKFIWGDDDIEHHDVKESLDEKFELKHDSKNNFGNPQQIHHSSNSHDHPHNKNDEPHPDSEAHEDFEAHHDNLGDDEMDSIRHYKSSGYKEINDHLRGAHKEFKAAKKKHFKQLEKEHSGLKFKDDPESHKHLKAANKHHSSSNDDDDHDDDDEPSDEDYHEHELDNHIHHLDNVTNHRTTDHHTVFRGGHPGDKTKFPIGHEFTDHGYVSTSFRKHTAQGFSSSHQVNKDKHGYGTVKHHIHVIHVPKGSRGHYFDVKGEDSDHSNHEEKEFVLHRGTRFKVTHHSEDNHNHYIHTRVVKQGIRHKFQFKSKQKDPENVKPKDDHGSPGQHNFPFMKHHKRFK